MYSLKPLSHFLETFGQPTVPASLSYPPGAENTIFLSEGVVLGESVYIGPFSQIIGDVRLGGGVKIVGNCVIDGTNGPVIIGVGTVIEPHTLIVGPAVIGKNCTILAGCIMRDSSCGDRCKLGAHINRTKMGHRVNAKYGDINLLDGTIGNDVNVSACTTFYNWGGSGPKKETWVGSGSFIGGKIIAPRRIGSNVYMVAGLKIRKDIPDNTYVDPEGEFHPNDMENDGNGHWVRIRINKN